MPKTLLKMLNSRYSVLALKKSLLFSYALLMSAIYQTKKNPSGVLQLQTGSF